MTTKPNDSESMLEKCTAAIAQTLPALSACVDRIRETLADRDEEYDIKLGSHLAWMTEKVVGISSELRQLEKHDKAMTKSPEQRHKLVLDYLRKVTPEQRAEIIAQLQADHGRSVLG